jgi:hypothetical protein
MPPLLTGSSILTKSPDSRNGEKGQKNGKPENSPLEDGTIIHHLGKWCIAPCGQQMISVDFQSAPIITGEATLPL